MLWDGWIASLIQWTSVSQSVQLLSRVWFFVTPWISACQASLSKTNSRSSLRLTSIDSVMPSSHKFEQIPGVGDGQGSLACCSPWGHKESDTTERLNWADHNLKAVNSSRGQKDTMNLVTKYQSRRSNKR